MKGDLTPPWLGGKGGVGPFPPADKSKDAFDTIKKYADGKPAAFADAAISMDRDILTGVQTHWIKLLRESSTEERAELFKPLAKAWVDLSLTDGPEASPPGAPVLKSLKSPPVETVERPYDRAMGLGEVIDHTLDGLGIRERQQFTDILKSELQQRQPQLEAREQELRQGWGASYPGIDVAATLAGKGSPEAVAALGKKLDAPASALQSKTARYWDLMDWTVNSPTRYGNINLSLDPHDPEFANQPLAISEFFNQTEKPAVVTPLGKGPSQSQTFGNPNGPETKLSMVLEGGGAKGFAYPECLKDLEDSLNHSSGKFTVDEFTGTSAGAITAGLLAAGFAPGPELTQVMNDLDFKKFNADAIWLEGGVDPKVRGVDRTGMFSMQKMYTELYDLLSKKLGVVGRPILFRDLPFKLNVTDTVMNTGLPENDPLRKLIDQDGRMVMSSDTTPNFDVVGAILGSAAVPGFFNSPQMEVFRGNDVHHIQLADGGTVDNMPATETQPAQAMVMVPAHYTATDPKTGQLTELSELNFDDSNVGVINDHNDQLYSSFAPQLGDFLSHAGLDRAVIAFNLARQDEQQKPMVMGKTQAATDMLFNEAAKAGMPQMDKASAQKLADVTDHKPTTQPKVFGAVFQHYLEADSAHQPLAWHLSGNTYTPGKNEARDILALGQTAAAAQLSTQYRPFQQAV